MPAAAAAFCLLMGTLHCSYNTYNQHYKEVQCFQQQVEPLLVKYGVNFVFFGEAFLTEHVFCTCKCARCTKAMSSSCGMPFHWCSNALPAGHVHAYERTWPVNNYKLDHCGPVNIIIGELWDLFVASVTSVISIVSQKFQSIGVGTAACRIQLSHLSVVAS